MFGWGKKKDAAVVAAVCANIRPLFVVLEQRMQGLPKELASDPFVIGYVVGAATIFTQVETGGKASQALKGEACLSALQTAFSAHHLSLQQASAAMQLCIAHADAKRGARAADLVLGVAAGFTDQDGEPEVVAAKRTLAETPGAVKEMLGGTPQSQLMQVLQDQLFFNPIEARYRAG
jgi:hypothetical protein